MTREVSGAEVAAAAWDARLRSSECSAQEREQFATWMEADPSHRLAFARLQSALDALRMAKEHPQLRALREAARLMERQKERLRWAGAAAASFILLGGGYWSIRTWQHPLEHREGQVLSQPNMVSSGGEWSTGRGERRTVLLSDGSSATLNASTRIKMEGFGSERRVDLVTGQAFFRVAKDSKRPFIVTAGQRSVTAVGTAFDVRLDADRVEVTLLEGRVAIKGLGSLAAQPVVELEPSQQLLASGDQSSPTVRAVNAVAESAWTDGQVVFVDEALPDAVAQMNRYGTDQVIAGPELARFRVNGVFRADNQAGFVSALTSYFPIEAVRDSGNRLVLRNRTPGGSPQ